MSARLTLKCPDCKTILRCEPMPPTTVIGGLDFCPKCGSNRATALQDHEQDYWEILSTDLRLPIDFVRELYQQWAGTDNWRKFHRFVDYVKSVEDAA